MYAVAQLKFQDECQMMPMKPSSVNPDNAKQGHRYSFHFISVPISLFFQKLNALPFMEKTLLSFLGLLPIASSAAKILTIRFSSVASEVSQMIFLRRPQRKKYR